MHHGVTCNSGSRKVCSPAIFETCFSYNKDIWIATTYNFMYSYITMLFPLTACLHYSPINKFYSFIIFSLRINAVILLLNCLVLIHYLYIISFSL